MNVAGASEQLQGRNGHRRVMMEGAAKTVDIEIESAPFSLALGNLIERGKVGIHLANVVAVGKSLRHSRLQPLCISAVGQQHGIGRLSVASAASGFLKIRFDRIGHVHVNNQSHVGFVNAHTKGVGSHHHAHLVGLPGALSHILVERG